MDSARSWASAPAVRDGRVAAVGTDDAVRPQVGPRSRVIELRGRTVTPGFQDAHVHPVHGGLTRLGCDLSAARGRQAVLQVIAEYADATAMSRGSSAVVGTWPTSLAGRPGGRGC